MINYVIFCRNISRIGGAQYYVLWKAQMLKNEGYNILLVSCEKEPLLLNDFDNFELRLYPETCISPFLFSQRKIDSVVNKICNFIKTKSKPSLGIICESIDVVSGIWAERVAEKLEAISLIYEVSGNPIVKREIAWFAYKKIKTNQLIGCSSPLLRQLFQRYPDCLPNNEGKFINIPSRCNTVIEGADGQSDYNYENKIGILTVSRVAKKYLSELIKETILLANRMPYKNIVLTMVLNKKRGAEVRKLQRIASSLPKNLEVLFLGPMVPLPLSLFQKNVVFVGMGTAALNAVASGLPVVISSPDNNLSSGIFGIDIFSFGYKREYASTISEKLFNLLTEAEMLKKAKDEGMRLFREQFSEDIIKKQHLDWIARQYQNKKIEYFNVSDFKLTFRDKIKSIILKIFKAKICWLIALKIKKYNK
jgi:hypothetical protein